MAVNKLGKKADVELERAAWKAALLKLQQILSTQPRIPEIE
ncbi:MAG: hypothetical protein ACREV5_06520 [Steroidobacter sp.]